MSLQHGMIEPFVADQVRNGAISYGLSSYGYDMRIADEFKVFTNVFNTLVDPKHFDPRSFVDVKAEHCDIPPNSFVLARSVEYFRIPRRVLSVVLGKSTYARCFSGNTRVALVDGLSMPIAELAEQWDRGVAHWGYSVGPHGRIIATLLEQPRIIGRDSLLEVTLDNGRTIHCTPDHEFLLRDGTLAQADALRPGASLMPLYTELFRGYEGVYQPLTGHYTPTHRLADDWNIRHAVYAEVAETHRHHIDHNRRNNAPWNIMRVPATEHISYHNKQFYQGPEFDAEEHGRSNRAALERRAADPAWQQRYSVAQAERAHVFRGTPMRNHKVTEIRELAGTHDVYCLTVPEAGNFALEAGVFVRNCGLIVNVTPLEPEWQGYVTIEISNTTPLPARVYANEGIAQVLFLESDEDCMISYADKSGKYQNQVGVVPPRM
jgi:deoxycytidine triphosphate deaminase